MRNSESKVVEVLVDEVSYPIIIFYPQYISPPIDKPWQMRTSFRNKYSDEMADSGRYMLLDSLGGLYRLSKPREFGLKGLFFRIFGLGYLAPVLTACGSLSLPHFRKKLISACRSRSNSDGGNYGLLEAIEKIKDAPSFLDAIRCMPERF